MSRQTCGAGLMLAISPYAGTLLGATSLSPVPPLPRRPVETSAELDSSQAPHEFSIEAIDDIMKEFASAESDRDRYLSDLIEDAQWTMVRNPMSVPPDIRGLFYRMGWPSAALPGWCRL